MDRVFKGGDNEIRKFLDQILADEDARMKTDDLVTMLCDEIGELKVERAVLLEERAERQKESMSLA